MAYSKAKFKSISLFQTIPNRKHVRQIPAYPDSAVRLSDTFLLALAISWGYQTLSEYYVRPPS